MDIQKKKRREEKEKERGSTDYALQSQNVPSSTLTASLWGSTWKQDATLKFIDILTLSLAAKLTVILNFVLLRIQRVNDARFDLERLVPKSCQLTPPIQFPTLPPSL